MARNAAGAEHRAADGGSGASPDAPSRRGVGGIGGCPGGSGRRVGRETGRPQGSVDRNRQRARDSRGRADGDVVGDGGTNGAKARNAGRGASRCVCECVGNNTIAARHRDEQDHPYGSCGHQLPRHQHGADRFQRNGLFRPDVEPGRRRYGYLRSRNPRQYRLRAASGDETDRRTRGGRG